MSNPSTTRQVIIDSDAGCDDAVALCLLFKSCNVQVLACTSVHGNVSQPQATENLNLLAKILGNSCPVYPGAVDPIIGSFQPCPWEGHGKNGLGEARFDDEFSNVYEPTLVQQESAAAALVRLVQQQPNQIDVIAVGPLTNIALAIKLCPDFLALTRSVWVMGGSHYAKGNTSFTAEFNFHQDPEAAFIVVDAFKKVAPAKQLNLVTWEACEDHSLSWTEFDSLASIPTFGGSFFKRISSTYEKMTRPTAELPMHHHSADSHPSASVVMDPRKPRTHREVHYLPCDAYCVAAYVEQDNAESPLNVVTHSVYADIELTGKLTRGCMAIDWYNTKNAATNVRLITDMSKEYFIQMLAKAFTATTH